MTTPRPCKFVAVVIGFLCSFVLAFAAPVKFEIPAQPAPSALKVFVKQSGTQVVFNPAELDGTNANEVKGEFEPADALAALLKGSGFVFSKGKGGIFVVKRAEATVTTGSLRGSLTGEGGKGLAEVLVSIRETTQSTSTNRYGVFSFPNVAAGTYVLVASAPGYQTMHITDVVVRAGRELTLGKEDMRKAGEGVLALDPFVVHADAVTELEKFEVTGTKQKPFEGGNVDIPRTINDAQPYYIFDGKAIESSGAANIEEFLKQRLTMNTVAQTNAQVAGVDAILGNTSSINLRGVGTDKTLILVNGRRMAGVNIAETNYQTDLNGIPLSAIDRVEVLPSSASGIYGGSAIGGVVNVILRKDYQGGEIRVTYDNTWDTDSPQRTVGLSYGLAFEGGKTHVTLNASWTDKQPLLLQDRVEIFKANLASIQSRSPAFIFSSTNPWLGALPNIAPSSPNVTSLALKNNGNPISLNSRNTYISTGTSSTISASALATMLLANAGQWNLDYPATGQAPTGLLRPFGSTPKTRSFQAGIRRQMLPALEVFADFSYNENKADSIYYPAAVLTVQAAAPTSLFTTGVQVRLPDATQIPVNTNSQNRSATIGAVAQLPRGWTGALDYTWSENRFAYRRFTTDVAARTADLLSGVLNPFVDTLQYPLNFNKYLVPQTGAGVSRLHDVELRGSGPLPSLPWGTPTLTVGLECRIAQTPERIFETLYPVTVTNNTRGIYYARESRTDSGYAELAVPLVKSAWLAGLDALELQISGRSERYLVDTGTPFENTFLNRPVPNIEYGNPTLNGKPYFSEASYTSKNYTVGLKYRPVGDVTVRLSRATAFLPPTPAQLITDTTTTQVTLGNDPRTGQQNILIDVLGGGNPNLKPQSSKSLNAGVIWEPTWKVLQGLRLNAEYYKIEQFNAISSLGAQTIVNQEGVYQDRVTRNSSGQITLVDDSALNLYRSETEGWDLSASYALRTGIGVFTINAVESIILHLKTQYAQPQPEYDAINFPAEGGAAKYKTNATLSWEWRRWTAGWTARYFSSYKQALAAGGPSATQRAATGVTAGDKLPLTTYTLLQGSDTVPSQIYHDLFVGYAFGVGQKMGSGSQISAMGSKLLSGLSVQFGVRNVFDKVPPLDAFYASNYYLSPYGDMRLRSYWLTVKKAF